MLVRSFFCLASINHSKSAIRNEIFANIYIIQTLKAFVDGIDFEGEGGGSHRSRTWMASDLEVFFSLFDEIGLNYGPGSVVFFLLHNSSYRVEFQMTVSGRGSIEIHGVAPFIDVRFDGEKSARKGFQMLS